MLSELNYLGFPNHNPPLMQAFLSQKSHPEDLHLMKVRLGNFSISLSIKNWIAQKSRSAFYLDLSTYSSSFFAGLRFNLLEKKIKPKVFTGREKFIRKVVRACLCSKFMAFGTLGKKQVSLNYHDVPTHVPP